MSPPPPLAQGTQILNQVCLLRQVYVLPFRARAFRISSITLVRALQIDCPVTVRARTHAAENRKSYSERKVGLLYRAKRKIARGERDFF